MEWIASFFRWLWKALNTPLYSHGDFFVSAWTVMYLCAILILIVYFSGRLKHAITYLILSRTTMPIGVRIATGSLVRYVVVIAGVLVLLQTIGIDITTLNVLAGALGIGVGLGLQGIANNFISGLIILFEGPLKVGDRVEIGNVTGDVSRIGAISTSVVTNDNITIILPNAKVIADPVVNWSHNDNIVRFAIPVSVAFGSNIRMVEKTLLAVAHSDPDVLADPPPAVRFREFGEYSLRFERCAWTKTLTHRKGLLVSKLNVAIHDAFRKKNIVMPYPVRDVRIRRH